MHGMRVTFTIHLAGTLGANQQGVIPAWKNTGFTLLEVAAVASNDSDATLKIGIGGTNADDDGIMTAKAIGDSNTPKFFTVADFNGALADSLNMSAPRLGPGDTVTWTLDYDGAGGTAAANVDIVFTVLEGGVDSNVTGLNLLKPVP